MSEDVKAYLIIMGAFIVSIVSFLSDLLDKDIPFTAKHTIHLLKAGFFGAGLGIVAVYGRDIILSHFLAKDIFLGEMVRVGITSLVAGLSPYIFAIMVRKAKKEVDNV